MKRILSRLMAFVMVVSLLPSAAVAADAAAVAKIGEEEYATLDDAVTAAEADAVIEILGDCTTVAGLNLSKNLTIRAAEDLSKKPTITFKQYGIALWGKSITFKNCNIKMNGIGSTPYYQEWGWMSVCGQAGSAINLINADMSMDGQGQNKHAIYADNGMKLYLNQSNLVIQNYGQDALEWNGGSFEYNVELIDSTYTSDHNRSGFTGTFNVKATKSRVNVINSTGNGSNGSNFYFEDSEVNFSDNGSHGLSATVLKSTNTPITANRNGLHGIIANKITFTNCKGDKRIQSNENDWNGIRDCVYNSPGFFTVVNSDLELVGNGYSKNSDGNWTDSWSGLSLKNVKNGTMDASSTLTITGSANNGMRLANSDFTIATGADVVIMENDSPGHTGGNGEGGGIRLIEESKLELPSDAKVYNNHADKAGDDIYLGDADSQIIFGKVGSNWYLGGASDCEDQIDGWYDDANDNRWSAHTAPLYMKEFIPTASPVNGPLALKAAHGSEFLPPVEPDPESPAHKWEHSKSKTATNLDKNFESQVTLSLPSAEENLVSDVVFVLDKSTSADLEEQALNMLSDLKTQIDGTGAKVKVGVVIFNKEANVTEFKDLATEYNAIKVAIEQKISSGTNTHAGLLAGKALLDADTSVPAERKHLIFVSDGITYMFNQDPTVVAWNGIVDNAHLGDDAVWARWASPDCWKLMYGDQKFIPNNWDKWMSTVGDKLKEQGATYDYPYMGTIANETPKNAGNYKNYAMSVDKALYLTKQAYDDCKEAGYHCYAMPAEVGEAAENNPWGPSFMDYLADDEEVSFADIQNDIYYLLDAGSKVKDVIGSGKDNKDNAYNMDFVDDASKLSIKVGTEVLTAVKLEQLAPLGNFENTVSPTSSYGFGLKDDGTYRFVLRYFAKGTDGKCDECFVWDINEAVSNFAPVQLTYTVKLTNPQKDAGIYGKFDADGSKGYIGLYTNASAILYPEDSNGEYGEPEEFAKPTVSYTVKNSGGGGGSGSDGDKPVLNTRDHYSYIIGYKDGNVRPYGLITRGEVATIFFRLLTDEARDKYWSQDSGYADCSKELWCNNAISTLTNMGIIDGYKDGNFYPYRPITRAQFAKMSVGFFDTTVEEYKGYFTDVTPDAWYTEYIEAAVRAGLIKGFVDGSYRPNVNITRAQACVIVNRALDRHPHEDHLLPAHKMITWPDNNPGDWFYADMQEATNSHDYHMTSSQEKDPETGKWLKIEDWTKKLPQRDWAAFEHAWADAHSAPFEGEVVVSGTHRR